MDQFIRTVDPVTSPEWQSLIDSTASSVFHSPAWLRTLAATYGVPATACVMEREGRPVAGVPWHLHEDPLSGPRRITLAFSDHCDVLATEEAAGQAVIEHVLADQESPWTLRTCTLPRVELPAGHSGKYLLHSIDLRPDTDALWASAHKAVRNAVRKAEREDVDVRLAESKSDLRAWYQVHLQVRKMRHRLLPQPYTFFEQLWDTFVVPGRGFLLLAVHGNEIIGGDLFLLWNDECYYKFNASTAEGFARRASSLLLWKGIEEAKERGCSSMDLGRTPVENTGLAAFKAHFGAASRPLYGLVFDACADPARADREEAAHALLRSVTDLLTDPNVPDSVTEEAGALLYWRFA